MGEKHTPGPWHVGEANYKKNRGRKFPMVYAAGEELKYIAFCDDTLYFYEPTDNMANACLIAAAPDYAKSAPDAADLLEHYADFIRREVKADDLERHPYLPLIEQTAADLRAAIAKATPTDTKPAGEGEGA